MMSSAPAYTTNAGVIDAARRACGLAVIDAWEKVGEVTLVVARDLVVAAMTALRDDLHYEQLMEIAGVDYPERAERFEVVYHLLSVTKNHRIRVKVSTDEVRPVPSVTDLWPVAGWLEREVFDMYGVLFSGNSDLRRILTDYGFVGHPQRKDFPLTGFVELRYSDEAKRVVYEPVQLAQDFRTFDFLSPWEGAEYALPGDEKAKLPEAKGAPSPVTADQVQKAHAAETLATSPPPRPKVTEHPSDTGAGAAANEAAQRPRKSAAPSAGPRALKPSAPRKPKGVA